MNVICCCMHKEPHNEMMKFKVWYRDDEAKNLKILDKPDGDLLDFDQERNNHVKIQQVSDKNMIFGRN